MPAAITRTFLLDIEGTTTPIEFVHEVLFPFARRDVSEFISKHSNDDAVKADLSSLREENIKDVANGLEPPSWKRGDLEDVTRYVHWLIDQDRKSTALKSLQGKIWEAGYRSGELKAPVYEDVPRVFARWKKDDTEIAIFSSGSVLAQKLLFAHTTAGDLTSYLSGYFDTTTGPKADEESYRRISTALGLIPGEIRFVSDVTSELDAAKKAGMQTSLCVRPGRPEPDSPHAVIRSFDELQ